MEEKDKEKDKEKLELMKFLRKNMEELERDIKKMKRIIDKQLKL